MQLGLVEAHAELEQRLALLAHPLAGIDPKYAQLWSLVGSVEQHLRAMDPCPVLPSKFSIIIDAEPATQSSAGIGAAWLGASADIHILLRPSGQHASIYAAREASCAPQPERVAVSEVPYTVVRLMRTHFGRTNSPAAPAAYGATQNGSPSLRGQARATPSERAPASLRDTSAFIGFHSVSARDGSTGAWFGLGLPFGSATTDTWLGIAELAERYGTGSLRVTPRRSVILPGVSQHTRAALERDCAGLGLICDPSDPLLHVEACPGAPACATALGETRQLARSLAQTLRPALERGATLHVSGCSKGCACSGPASVTVVRAADGCKLGFATDVAQLMAATAAEAPGPSEATVSLAEVTRRLASFAHTRGSDRA
jgi:sulfite reductase beta subunit-like hemoprotein